MIFSNDGNLLKRYLSMLAAGLVLLLSSSSALAQNAQLRQGLEAYKAKNYQQALRHFDAAQAQGINSPSLRYNRAVTLYRLRRLSEAKQAFSALKDDAKWGELARYNLGLIAQLDEDWQSAIGWFEQVATLTANAKLKTLAQQKLASLRAQVERQAQQRSAILFTLGATRDNNAANLADELSVSASGAEDVYFDALFYGHHYVQGKPRAGRKIYGLAYKRDFQDFDLFNASILGVGLDRELGVGNVATELGMRITHTQVASTTLAQQFTLSSAGHKTMAEGRLRLSAQSSYFDSADRFAHIKGWQHQLQAQWRRRFEAVTVKPSLTWQRNDREDKHSATRTFSYSPRVLTLAADVDWRLDESWTLLSGLALAVARYDGENRLVDVGGVEKEEQRKYRQFELSLGARYRLAPRWSLLAEYKHKDTDDSFDLYSYDKQSISFKLEYQQQ